MAALQGGIGARIWPSMQLVGLLLIVNSLVCAAWWVASGRPQLVVIPICVAALAAGVFLMIYDRIAEVALKGSGTIKAAAQQAAKDAAEIGQMKQQIAAQIPAHEKLSKLNSDAVILLTELQDQTAAAEWHLNQLDEHMNATQILPDGRVRVANTVTGQPVVLISKLEALEKLAAEKPAEAYPLAKECVGIYEATRDQVKGVVLAGGDLGIEAVAWLYTAAATSAQRAGEHDNALEWARAAVAARPSVERQFLLVTALINKNLQEEANAVIQRELKAGGASAGKFRQFLDQYKISYKAG
jgi:hypothetical protein